MSATGPKIKAEPSAMESLRGLMEEVRKLNKSMERCEVVFIDDGDQPLDAMAKAIGGVMWTESFDGTDDTQRSQFREAAILAAQALDAAGFVIVPKEPTRAMVRAGESAPFVSTAHGNSNTETTYRAMIAKALQGRV